MRVLFSGRKNSELVLVPLLSNRANTSPDRAFIRVMKETDPSIAILYEATFSNDNMQYVIDNALRGMDLEKRGNRR